jgi:GDP-L-fucose synthase
MKLLITGSNSMIGKALLRNDHLKEKYEIVGATHSGHDLCDYSEAYDLFKETKPDYVIHLASLNGNIEYNSKYPSSIFMETTEMALNVLRISQQFAVKKVVSAISSCAYPSNNILRESEFFNGEPHGSIESHGFAKRYIVELSRQLYRQYGFISVGMCFNTAYGPHDNFNLNKTKVMASLIKRFVDAKKGGTEKVTLWGTGCPHREFIYADDVARMFGLVLEKYSDPFYPINVGCGKDISIRELATLVADEVGYTGNVVFDTSKPDGQVKKLLCNEKMEKHFGPQSFTSLHEGIRKTVDWYESEYNYS